MSLLLQAKEMTIFEKMFLMKWFEEAVITKTVKNPREMGQAGTNIGEM